jgi:hypothetical protein
MTDRIHRDALRVDRSKAAPVGLILEHGANVDTLDAIHDSRDMLEGILAGHKQWAGRKP